MPLTPTHVDLFSQPHSQNKVLVEKIKIQTNRLNFDNDECYLKSLKDMSDCFEQLAVHENIEKEHILLNLQDRLPENFTLLKEFKHHNSGHSHLKNVQDLLSHGVTLLGPRYTAERKDFKKQLIKEVRVFICEYLPHMEEEENFFQPLLMEYFTETELVDLQKIIIALNNAAPVDVANSNLNKLNISIGSMENGNCICQLPNEIIAHIISYLNLQDRMRSAQVCKKFYVSSFSPQLWKHLYPTAWSYQKWECVGPPTSLLTPYIQEIEEEIISCPNISDREQKILNYLIKHILPICSHSVQTFVLRHSETARPKLILSILQICDNLKHLDLGYCELSDITFGEPNKSLKLPNITYIDLTGCQGLTDRGLQRLTRALTHPTTKEYEISQTVSKFIPLKVLSLSGCYKLTYTALKSFLSLGVFNHLWYLDLSGCPNIDGDVINNFVALSDNLEMENVYYCNNILDGPSNANGCLNCECELKFCCQSSNFF